MMTSESEKNIITRNNIPLYRILAVLMLVIIGFFVAVWQPFSIESLLEWGRSMSRNPFTAVSLIFLQAFMLALALPGTLILWVVAPFYNPHLAALMLTAGSVIGAAGAYWISGKIRGRAPSEDRSGRIVTLLRKRGDLFMQLVLRVLPGFPHSVINYAAGMLGLPIGTFLVAAALGLSVKWLVYASSIHALVDVSTGTEQLGIDTVAPLLLLAVFLGMGGIVQHKIQTIRFRRAEERANGQDYHFDMD